MKRSPKGLFCFEPAGRRHIAKDSVEAFVREVENWANGILKGAGIELKPATSILKLAEKRAPDLVHWALIALHQAQRVRQTLEIAATKGFDAENQTIWAAERMLQLCGAAFSGLFVQLEAEIFTGMKVSDGGKKGGATTKKVTPEQAAEILRIMKAAPWGQRTRAKDKLRRTLGVSNRTIERVAGK